MPGATPVIVRTTMCEPCPCRSISGMMKFLPAKKMKLPRMRILSANGSTTRPKAPSTFHLRAR